jgi:hypothetical protein
MRYQIMKRSVLALMSALFVVQSLWAEDVLTSDDKPAPRQYTYSWMFSDADGMKPRGGTTAGPNVVLDQQVSAGFQTLQSAGLTPLERDRQAILTMAGAYRTSFDFIETVGFTPQYEPPAPYQSWGTERVYIVASEPDFISLQHIIVMHFAAEDGTLSAPMVVKHWRQDWQYQDVAVHAFQGNGVFERQGLDATATLGTWTQTVYQVDDSPRYEAIGRWTHAQGVSFWQSDDRRRPLPRREFSVREDYQTLFGSHRITITPHGWTQEEDALKLVLDERNNPRSEQPFLAREAGLSRYDRIVGYDFSAGDDYWRTTGPFWSRVRAYWTTLYRNESAFYFVKSVEGVPLFMALFDMADESFDTVEQADAAIQDTLSRYVTVGGLAATD